MAASHASVRMVDVGCRTIACCRRLPQTGERCRAEFRLTDRLRRNRYAPGSETISFSLTNASHQPVAGARVQVEGDMSHPGMAPVFADANEARRATTRRHFN